MVGLQPEGMHPFGTTMIGRTIKNFGLKTLAGAIAVSMATLAHAGTTLVGGGATLPSLGYVGSAAAVQKQVSPASSNSFFGVYSAQRGYPAVSYCLTGSGTGKNILAGVPGTSVQNDCPDTGTITGFGAPAVGRTDLTQPNFAAADSPLTQTDYSNYVTNRVASKPIEFPAVAGAIAIAFNKTDDQGSSVSAVNLTDSQICGVFSGKITDWSDARLAPAITLPAGHTVSGPINVQYRSDGSGSTFAFSNHLTYTCSRTPTAHFVADQAFTTVVSKFLPTVPANWTGSSGNAAVTAAIQANSGSIGYVEAANAITSGVNFALVDGQSPKTDLGNPTTHRVTVQTASLAMNDVINGADPNTGVAVLSPISPAPSTKCIALVKPSSYAKPTSGYPIIAISYLLGNSNGNGPDLAATKNLIAAPYTPTITNSPNLTTIGANTGLAFLTTTFKPAAVKACLIN